MSASVGVRSRAGVVEVPSHLPTLDDDVTGLGPGDPPAMSSVPRAGRYDAPFIEAAMRTNIVPDDELVQQAFASIGIRTKGAPAHFHAVYGSDEAVVGAERRPC